MAPWWNTGCNVIFNFTTNEAFVQDIENPERSLVIEPGSAASFRGLVFPWCDNESEVDSKAFRVHAGNDSDGRLLFYMFQKYNNNLVSWMSPGGSFTNNVQSAGAPQSSYVDVIIQSDDTPRAFQVS